jgi:hypothetical protein
METRIITNNYHAELYNIFAELTSFHLAFRNIVRFMRKIISIMKANPMRVRAHELFNQTGKSLFPHLNRNPFHLNS